VVIAAGRAHRPGAGTARIPEPTQEELDACPFCAGREERTPPEVLRLGGPPGWRVRVVPNLYPAFARQEVVVHAPEHVRSFADLADDDVALVAEAWALRARAGEEDGLDYLHAFVNEGEAAGSSLAHSHSQLVWLEAPPPALTAEHAPAVDALLARDDLTVLRRDGVAAVAHAAGRTPYELLLAPETPGDPPLAALLLTLRDCVRALRAVEGPAPWNAWLHRGPRPHLELVPRLAALAGVELGAGIHVNPLPPEEAAARLRAALG
jgi:UDPglucose--hexose-1-phosphate uridylyltransferase